VLDLEEAHRVAGAPAEPDHVDVLHYVARPFRRDERQLR
jgi:hypothetical protein